MATAINTHKFEEAVIKEYKFHKTGESSFLWGLIKHPYGYYEENIIHTLRCKRCSQEEFAPIHGYHFLNNE